MANIDLPAVLDLELVRSDFFLYTITVVNPRVTMMTQNTTTTAAILYSATHNLSDSESGTAVIVGVGPRVMVVVRRNEGCVLLVGKLVAESVELLLSVIEFGVVVLAVVEAILAQLGTVVVCAIPWQVVALRAPMYSDCTARNSLLLGVSSVPLDNSAWQKYHPA